jgi:ADP-heptose:LPS heptosyltransferase
MTDAALQETRLRLDGGGKLLITRLRYIGDVVLSLPLVQVLRRAFPAAEIHYLAEPEPLEVLRHHPAVDRTWCVPRRAGPALRAAWNLRRAGFAAVIDLFANPRSALLAFASGAAVRIGEARATRAHWYTHARRLPPDRSALEQHLDAAALLGVQPLVPEPPRLRLHADESAPAAARAAGLARGRPLLLVHPAATQRAKEWPEANMVALLRRLLARDVAVVLSTAPRRPEPSRLVAAALHGGVQLPPMPLRQLLGWVQAADAVLAVDGGILHCSVALGRPTLALFGPTPPGIWFPYAGFGPYRVLHAGVDCSRCDRDRCPSRACMAALDVERVEAALEELLPRAAPGRRA